MLKGVDISKYQGKVDFPGLAKAVDFVIIKASAGDPDPGQTVAQYEDPDYSANVNGARGAGLLIGSYHFAYPQYNDPEPEAEEFYKVITSNGGPRQNEIYALDFEEATSKDVVDWCKRFLDHFANLMGGYKGLLYINYAMTQAHDWSPLIKENYGLWLAEWDFNPAAPMDPRTPWPFLAFRQYSDKENIDGLSPVDADVFYGDRTGFDLYGYQPAVPAPATPTPPTPPVAAPTQPPVPAPVDTVPPVPTEGVDIPINKPKPTPMPDPTPELTPVTINPTVSVTPSPRGVFTSEFYMPFLLMAAGWLATYLNNRLNLTLTQDQIANAGVMAISGIGTVLTAYQYVKGRLELKKAAVQTVSSVTSAPAAN